MALSLDYLKELKDQVPIADAAQQAALAKTRAIQLQAATAQAPTTQPTAPAQAQAIGAQLAQQAGEAQVKGAQQQAARQVQLGQTGLASQQSQLGNQVAQAQEQSANLVHTAATKQAADALRQNTSNEEQKIAWAAKSAQNKIDFDRLAQQASQLHQRNMQMNQVLEQRLDNMIKEENQKGNQFKDQAHLEKLYSIKKFYQDKARADQAAAADKAMMWKTGGTVVGTIVGGVAGGPGGAAAGGSLGGGLGSTVGSQV